MTDYPLVFGFIGYLILLVLIGLYGWKKTKNSYDYILAGRKLSYVTTAMSEASTLWSGWALIGFPALIYSEGLRQWAWGPAAVLGNVIVWIFFVKRISRYTRLLGSVTVPDFFEDRLRDNSHLLRGVLAITIEIFTIFYLAANIMAGADAISGVLGMPYKASFVIMLVLIVFYTVIGGFFAVAYTDVIQGLLMFILGIILPIFAILEAGGLSTIVANTNVHNPGFLSFTKGWSGTIGVLAFFSIWVNYGLLYVGQPHGVMRYMAMRRPSESHKAMLISAIFCLIMTLAGFFIGLAGYTLIPGLEGKAVDFLTPTLLRHLFPGWLGGILLAGLVAAIMSTADSQLLVCSTTIGEDFYKKLFRPNATDSNVLLVSRLAVILSAIIATIVAWFSPSIVHLLTVFAWAGLGATIAPPLILCIFWKKVTKWGVFSGMVASLVSVILWRIFVWPVTGINEALPAFFLNLLLTVIISLLTKAPDNVDEEMEIISKPLPDEEF